MWEPSPDAETYSVEVVTSGPYNRVEEASDLTSTSYRITSALEPGIEYTWIVTAYNSRGMRIAFNALWFTMGESEEGQKTDGNGRLEFADANLEAAVREAIGKPSGDIVNDDVVDLAQLNAQQREIEQLGGIEHLRDGSRITSHLGLGTGRQCVIPRRKGIVRC